MFTGPNINVENLIFGYDMDDRNMVYYKGEPTVNYASNNLSVYTPYFTYTKRDGDDHYFYRHETSTGNYLAFANNAFGSDVVSGDVVTISGYFYKNNSPYKLTVPYLSTYNTTTTEKTTSDDGFFSYTQVANQNGGGWIFHHNLCNAATGDTITIKKLQIEKKSHKTQFLPSGKTRTNLSSLYDLKTKTPINTTTLSFDSKAHPYFNGIDNYLILNDIEKLNKNFSVCAWVYLYSYNENTNVGQVIFQQYGGSRGWIFSLVGPQTKLQLRHHNGSATSYNLIYGTSLNLNTWYFVSASDDGSLVKIYVNGEIVSSRSSVYSVVGTSSSKVGCFETNYYLFNGKINSLYLFKKTLTDSEVKNFYNSTKNKFGYLT